MLRRPLLEGRLTSMSARLSQGINPLRYILRLPYMVKVLLQAKVCDQNFLLSLSVNKGTITIQNQLTPNCFSARTILDIINLLCCPYMDKNASEFFKINTK